MTRNRNCPASALANATVAEIVTGGGHVYPLPEYGLTIFRGHLAASESQQTTGFPGKTGDRDRGGGERRFVYKKIVSCGVTRSDSAVFEISLGCNREGAGLIALIGQAERAGTDASRVVVQRIGGAEVKVPDRSGADAVIVADVDRMACGIGDRGVELLNGARRVSPVSSRWRRMQPALGRDLLRRPTSPRRRREDKARCGSRLA